MGQPEIWPRKTHGPVADVPGPPGSGGSALEGEVFEVVDVEMGAGGEAWYDHVATLPTEDEAECWAALRYPGNVLPDGIGPRCDRRRTDRDGGVSPGDDRPTTEGDAL